MKWVTLFCFISVFAFSQNDKQRVFLQAACGNTSFINPTVKTNAACPSVELTLLSNSSKKDSSKTVLCFLAGFGFSHTNQSVVNQFITLNNATQLIPLQTFYTNECTFSVGANARYNLSKLISINFALAAQVAGNFTWFDGEAMPRSYQLNSLGVSAWTNGGASSQNNVTNLSYSSTQKIEFYQFYLLGKLQLGVRISNRVSFVAAISPKFFIWKNDVSVDTPDKFFNYAPIKLTTSVGLQIKLFK